MPLTNFANGVASFGAPVLGGGIPLVGGTTFFCDPVSGSDSNDGLSPQTAFLTLSATHSAMTTDKNDAVYLIGHTSAGVVETATLTWSKSCCHIIGIGAPSMESPRARIGHTGAFSPLMNVTGSGCIFTNISLMHGNGSASNLICLQVTGSRNYFGRCHIKGMLNATEGDEAGAAHLKIDGGAENLFEECIIGNDTTLRSAANTNVLFDSSAARNWFKRCTFPAWIDNAGVLLMKYADATAVDRYIVFEDCLFSVDSVNHATAATIAFSVPVSTATNRIYMRGDNVLVGATDWGDANSDAVMYFTPATATANAIGLGINPAVS